MREKALEYVKPYYNNKNRCHHTMQHIHDMLEYVGDSISDELYFAILFHDIIYLAHGVFNESDSCKKLREYTQKNNVKIDTDKACHLIMTTNEVYYSQIQLEGDHQLIVEADFSCLIDLDKAIKYEENIFKEYQRSPVPIYRKERINFLNGLKEKNFDFVDMNVVDFLINYVRNKTYNIGIYAGSFNPYHLGHEDIALQAEQVFGDYSHS